MTTTSFGHAYEVGFRRTIAFLLSRGVSRQCAPDIAQSAWLRGWERLSTLREDKAIFFWINSIALNQYREWVRGSRREEPWPEGCDPQTLFDSNPVETRQILRVCPSKYRLLFRAQLAGLTMDEIAAHTGTTETAVRAKMHRARNCIREALRIEPHLSSSAAA
jgi:RNA polymerase sigma-70 factor (ECF subfamily)